MTATAVPRSQVTSTAWAVAVLTKAKLPVTQTNVDNMLRWMQLEGGSAPPNSSASGSMETWLANNDPLNASLHTSGQFHYTTIEDGITGTAAMLQQKNMASIYNALKVSASTAVFSRALAASPWDGSHYASQIAQYGSNFLAAFPELAAFATQTGTNPTSTIGGIVGIGSQPSTSINAVQKASDVTQTAAQIGKELASGAKVLGQTPQKGIAGIASEFGTVGTELSTITHDVTDMAFWKRVGIFLGGGALAIVGLVLLIHGTSAGKEATSVATTAALA